MSNTESYPVVLSRTDTPGKAGNLGFVGRLSRTGIGNRADMGGFSSVCRSLDTGNPIANANPIGTGGGIGVARGVGASGLVGIPLGTGIGALVRFMTMERAIELGV